MVAKVFVLALATCLPSYFSVVNGQCDGEQLALKADTVQRTFDSPNYPEDYPENSYCQWLLSAPNEHYIVRLDTLAMDLETTQDCTYDSITIYDGEAKNSTELAVYCVGYFSIYSTGHHLLVIFKSDNTYQARGFRLRYVALLKNPPSRTTPATTTVKEEKKGGDRNWVNTGALIGGVVGGVCFVIILGIVCGRCVGRGELRQPPAHRAAAFYHSHAPPITPLHEPGGEGSTISTAVHMMQNNNTVFMVSQAMGGNIPPARFMTSHMTNGVTNMAFDGSGERPLRGMSAMMEAIVGPPPPCYTDTMLVTHPPKIPPSPGRQNPGTDGLAPPPLRASRVLDDTEEPGPSGEAASLPVPSVRIEISPPENDVPQRSEVPSSPEEGTQQELENMPSQESPQQSEILPPEVESPQQSDTCCPETESLQQSDADHVGTEAPQQSENSLESEAQQQSQSHGAEAPSEHSKEEAPQQGHISPSETDGQPDSCFQVEASQQSEMSETNSPQAAIAPPEASSVALEESKTFPYEAEEALQQAEISQKVDEDSQNLEICPSETEVLQNSENCPLEAEAGQPSEICSPGTETLQTATEIPKSQYPNPESEVSPQSSPTSNPQASASPSSTVNPATSSEDPAFKAVEVHKVQNELDSGTLTPRHHCVSEIESSQQEVNEVLVQNYSDQEDSVISHPIIKEPDCHDGETHERSSLQNEEDDGGIELQTPVDSEVNVSVQEEAALAAEMVHSGVNENMTSQMSSASLSDTDNAENVDDVEVMVTQSGVAYQDSDTQQTTQNETREATEMNPDKAGSDLYGEDPNHSPFNSAEHEGHSAYETEIPVSSEPQSQPTVILTEHPEIATENTSTPPGKPPEDIPAEQAALAADASEALEAAPCPSSTDLTSLTSSLPPPPSPHAVSDSDSESFPPAPTPLAVDTMESSSLPRIESPSILLETFPDDECLDNIQTEYLGGGSEEELYGAASFASLSSHSSPLLTERQLRNSTSFPDIAKQVEVIKRETLQRADSQ